VNFNDAIQIIARHDLTKTTFHSHGKKFTARDLTNHPKQTDAVYVIRFAACVMAPPMKGVEPGSSRRPSEIPRPRALINPSSGASPR